MKQTVVPENKTKIGQNFNSDKLCINVKVNPEWRDLWWRTYAAVLPGYHQNKEHWNTIMLDGTILEEEVKRMIAESYDLICRRKSRGE